MSVDGNTVTVDHTAIPKAVAKETTFGGSKSITVKREIEPLLSEVVGGASAAYSLRDLNDKAGNNKVVRVRRASDNHEKDFRAKELKDIETWVNAQTVLPLDIQELEADGRTGDLVEAAAAYSLRNLSSSFTGSVVDVRRSSDDAEDSFTASDVSDGTLVAWVGAGNDGFVSTWYDQSGNANHATQGADASQPKIVDGGSLVSGGLDFDGADDQLDGTGITASLATLISVSEINASANQSYGTIVIGGTDATAGSESFLSYYRGFTDTHAAYQGSVLDSGISYSLNTTYLKFDVLDNTNSELFVNGSSIATGTTGSKTASSAAFSIGRARGGTANFLNGQIAEIIIYDTDQSDNRVAIEADINDHYDIYA
jgi:methylglyoxal synthase